MIALLLICAMPGQACASDGTQAARGEEALSPAVQFAHRVEARALQSTFKSLERFGHAAAARSDAEGLSRLHHVIWITINQGEFPAAERWNAILATNARRLSDRRYLEIARVNQLRIRHLRDHDISAVELRQVVAEQTHWLSRAFARMALARRLFDDNRIGEALHVLAATIAEIPEDRATEASVAAAAWDIVGIAHIMIDDVPGHVRAADRAEGYIAASSFPRPDHEGVYNLAQSLSYLGHHDDARQLVAIYGRLAQRVGTPTAIGYAGNICAFAAASRDDWQAVLACLAPFGPNLEVPAIVRNAMLPFRATAYARTGQVDHAKRDLAEINRSLGSRKKPNGVRRAEAELLIARGDYARGIPALRAYNQDRFERTARTSAAAVEHVVDSIDAQLKEAVQGSQLQSDVIVGQRRLVAALVLLGILLVALAAMLARQRRLYLAQATIDPLTGLPNRRYTEARANEIVQHALTRDGRAVVGILDLDHFKSCNDRFGHDAGDEALKAFADVVRQTIRPGDVFGRWGGEEFVLVVPNARLGEAQALLTRIRAAAEAVELRRSPDYPLHFSGGVVAVPQSARSLEQALQIADRRLYMAKQGGRNRTQFEGGDADR